MTIMEFLSSLWTVFSPIWDTYQIHGSTQVAEDLEWLNVPENISCKDHVGGEYYDSNERDVPVKSREKRVDGFVRLGL